MAEHEIELPRDRRQHPGRVDSFLVDRHDLHERVCAFLDALPTAAATGAGDLRELRRQLRGLGSGALRCLVDVFASGEGTRTEAAFIALGAFAAKDLASEVRAALSDASLPRAKKVRLLALSAFESDQSFDLEAAMDSLGAELPELVESFTSIVGGMLEPEEVALMWLREFGPLPPADRVRVLDNLVRQSNPYFIPILDLESRSPDPGVRLAVAQALKSVSVGEATEIAVRMHGSDPDLMVRYEAGRALEALNERGELPRQCVLPRHEAAYALCRPAIGIATIFYAARDSRDRIKFCSMVLDTWGRGIEEAWGSVGHTGESFREIIEDLNSRSGGRSSAGGVEPVSRDYAVFLIRETLRVALRRGRAVPPEYWVWEGLFRHESCRYDPASSPFQFDLHCSECRRAILPNRLRNNLHAGPGLALCRKCLGRARNCHACAGGYRLGALAAALVGKSHESGVCGICAGARHKLGFS